MNLGGVGCEEEWMEGGWEVKEEKKGRMKGRLGDGLITNANKHTNKK